MSKPPPGRGARVARNSLLLLLARSVDLFASLGVAIIIARTLGVWGYGRYAFLLGLTQFIAPLINLGLEQIMIRENSRDPGNMPIRLYLGLKLVLILALITSIILLIVAFGVGLLQYELLALSIMMISLIARQSYEVVIRSGILAREKAEYEVLLVGAMSVCRFFLTLAISSYSNDLLLLVCGLAAADLGTVAGGLFLGLRLKLLQPGGSWSLARGLLLAALPIGVAALLRNSTLYVDTMFLEGFWGNAEVGLFAAAYRPVVLATFIIIPLLWPLLPQLVKSIQIQNPVKDISSALNVLVFLVVGPAIWIAIYAQEALRTLFGVAFMVAGPTLSILAITPLLRAIGYICDMGLVAAHRTGLVVISAGSVLIVNLILDIALIPQMGKLGAGWATLCAEGFGTVVGLIMLTRVWKERLQLKKYWAIGLSLLGSMPFYFLPAPIIVKATIGLAVYLTIGILTKVLPISLFRSLQTDSRT